MATVSRYFAQYRHRAWCMAVQNNAELSLGGLSRARKGSVTLGPSFSISSVPTFTEMFPSHNTQGQSSHICNLCTVSFAVFAIEGRRCVLEMQYPTHAINIRSTCVDRTSNSSTWQLYRNIKTGSSNQIKLHQK
jgi:hypothetical protein